MRLGHLRKGGLTGAKAGVSQGGLVLFWFLVSFRLERGSPLRVETP